MPPRNEPDDELRRAIERLAASRAERRAREAVESAAPTQPSRELPDYSGGYCEDCRRDPCACEPTHPQIVIERGAHAVFHVASVTETGKHRAMAEPETKIEAAAEGIERVVKTADSWKKVTALGLLLVTGLAAFALWLIYG
jgi:hypothetical protein